VTKRSLHKILKNKDEVAQQLADILLSSIVVTIVTLQVDIN